MGVISRVFFTITEVAARWGCTPADVAGLAHNGKLQIVTGIAPVDCGGEPCAGMVVIAVSDILPMFRRSGTGPRDMQVRRIRALDADDWKMVTEPSGGVFVSMEDLLILADDLHRFEADHDVFGRAHGAKGPEPRFDWDEFWREVAAWVHEHGVPTTLKEFTEVMSLWFMDRSGGKNIPSDSVIRKKLSPLWNRLRQDA